jgi:hypothetical protein
MSVTKNPLYNSWRQIQQALYNPKNINYPLAGGIGLSCDWTNSASFIQDVEAQFGPKPPDMKLGRKDQSQGWTLSNLEYSSTVDIGRRLPRVIFLEYNEKRYSLHQWHEITGIPLSTLRDRIHRGCSIKDVLGY